MKAFSPVLTIDVAHPPLHPDQVEEELLLAVSRIRNSSTLRVLKIIHGRGSSGRRSSARDTVRNWAFRHRNKFRAVVEGEEYTLYNAFVQQLRKEAGPYTDTDLGAQNSGITVLWIK